MRFEIAIGGDSADFEVFLLLKKLSAGVRRILFRCRGLAEEPAPRFSAGTGENLESRR